MKGLNDWRDGVGARVNQDVGYAQDMFSKGEKVYSEAKNKSLKVISERVNVQSKSNEINSLVVRDRV